MDPFWNASTRRQLFLYACIPARAIMAALPAILPLYVLPMYGVVTAVIAVGFLYLYFTGERMKAPEGGGVTWWSKLRLVHGMQYATAAIYLFQRSREATIPLALDILCGAGMFAHRQMSLHCGCGARNKKNGL